MACARTINITCHSTVDGVPEISVQDCAQTVAIAIEHHKLHWSAKKFFFQKSLNVKMILGYIKIAEPKYALSFFELALVFEI